jgi:hypothetical protein
MSEEKEKKVAIVSPTKQSKIVKYKLEEDCINLKKADGRLSYQDIADELNRSGKVPPNDSIDKYVVARFLEKMPEVTKQVIKEDKRRMMEVVNTNFDVYYEINTLFAKTKTLLEMMEEDAIERGRLVDPYRFKAVSSEMREMLFQMTEIQKEINDYNNVRKFMEIVIQVLHEEAPEKIQIIAERLRVVKGTQWFSDLMSRGE